MARTASPTKAPKPVLSTTQAIASLMLARLLAHRRGRKMPADDRVRRPAVKHVKKEKERDVVDRNVLALKKSGKVGDEEKEVRKRILQMRDEAKGVKRRKKKAKKVVVVDEDEDMD